MKKLIITILIISLFLVSCAPPKEPELETTGIEDVDDVSSGISNVDTIDDDLSGAELDDLEKDLAEIDW